MKINVKFYLISICVFILGFICYQLLETLYFRPHRRKLYYKQAYQKSQSSEKPLMVIGDPSSGNVLTQKTGHQYGCGDICIDIMGCPKCTNQIKRDLTEILPKFKNNSHVIFVSCVLEFIPNLKTIYKELKRVSGNDLYIVYVKKPYILHKLFPYYYDNGTQFRFVNAIHKGPPEYPELEYSEL